jgi:HEAT repeat protein
MKNLKFAMIALFFGACAQPEKAPTTVRYWLPTQDLSVKKSSVERWGLAAPVADELSDPNAIVYDQAYIDAYVKWAVDTPIACGPATYWITTPEKVLQINSGLDEADLGRRFRADDLIAFLKTRIEGKAIERTFKINRADAAEMLREQPESLIAKRLGQSPWDGHTATVVSLLGLAQYKPAYPLLKSLVKDRSPGVRYSAVIALGRLSVVVPEAVPELARLLPDKELGANAATALTMAGAAAMPAIIEAMNHPDSLVCNRAVYSLGGFDPIDVALPGLLAALEHKDTTIRKWGLSVVIDMQGRAVSVGKDALVDTLGKRLLDGDDEIRRSAVIALFNLKEAAARARPMLKKAAAEDRDATIKDFAERALEAIGPETNEFSHKPVLDDLEERAKVKLWIGKVEELTVSVEVQSDERPKLKRNAATMSLSTLASTDLKRPVVAITGREW